MAVAGHPADFFQDYRALEDVTRYLTHLASEHPELTSLRELGRSWQGRPLKALEITKGNGTKPTIFLEGGIHAREWIATSTVLYIAGEKG